MMERRRVLEVRIEKQRKNAQVEKTNSSGNAKVRNVEVRNYVFAETKKSTCRW
jgi:hypothetical protein